MTAKAAPLTAAEMARRRRAALDAHQASTGPTNDRIAALDSIAFGPRRGVPLPEPVTDYDVYGESA